MRKNLCQNSHYSYKAYSQ